MPHWYLGARGSRARCSGGACLPPSRGGHPPARRPPTRRRVCPSARCTYSKRGTVLWPFSGRSPCMAWQRRALQGLLESLVSLAICTAMAALVFYVQYRQKPEDMPLVRLLPWYLGIASVFPTMFLATILRSKERAGHMLLVQLATMNVVVAGALAVISFTEATDPHTWILTSVASGRLAFYGSALLFAVQL